VKRKRKKKNRNRKIGKKEKGRKPRGPDRTKGKQKT
jgi:hypothetical protein